MVALLAKLTFKAQLNRGHTDFDSFYFDSLMVLGILTHSLSAATTVPFCVLHQDVQWFNFFSLRLPNFAPVEAIVGWLFSSSQLVC